MGWDGWDRLVGGSLGIGWGYQKDGWPLRARRIRMYVRLRLGSSGCRYAVDKIVGLEFEMVGRIFIDFA